MILSPKDLIFESENSEVYLVQNDAFSDPIIVKVLKNPDLNLEKTAQFYNEYELTKNLKFKGIRRAFAKQEIANKQALLFNYFDGGTIKETFINRKYPLSVFLEIAIQITKILSEIHNHNIIHKDINSQNILFSPQKKEICIIDFGISTIFSTKKNHLSIPKRLEGTLQYISPEQTGRMNRFLDYRSDLYSLGVVFYEMLTSRLPFESEDPLELIHAHIAKNPERPEVYDQDIPEILSDIVMKLLSKNVEDRYQSANGLLYDLEKLKSDGIHTLSFRLGERDFSGKLQISQKLYGREMEIIELLSAYNSVIESSNPKSFFISGYSGIGKSSLVYELFKGLKITASSKTYFINGKFEEFQKDIPYSAWTMAFNEFVNFILSEDCEFIEKWKYKILDSIGDSASVITQIIPSLEKIIGKCPDAIEITGESIQKRLNYIFIEFIKIIAEKDHFLLIFIDDWQWADPASIQLLKAILCNNEIKNIVLLLAYRENELDSIHPFQLLLNELEAQNIELNSIQLTNLTNENIAKLLQDSLKVDESNDILILARIIYQKTGGNSFFANQFLYTIYEDGYLYFDQGEYKWKWNIDKIKSLSITENVVDLLITKLHKLPSNTLDLIKYAACMGHSFDLEILSIIYKQKPIQIIKDLEKAIINGFVYPQNDEYLLIGIKNNPQEVIYKFGHDKIHQAVYSLLEGEIKKKLHRQIGTLLFYNEESLDNFVHSEFDEIKLEEFKQIPEHIFEIINHINLGIELEKDENERKSIAYLNLIAAKKSRLASAFSASYLYLTNALNQIPSNFLQNDCSMSLYIYRHLCECSYLISNFESMDKYFNIVVNNSRNTFDMVSVYITKIKAFTFLYKLEEAIELGKDILKKLDFEIQKPISKLDITIEFLKTAWIFRKNSIENLFILPEMTNSRAIAIVQILDTMLSSAYITDQNLFSYIVLKMFLIVVKYGNCHLSPFVYTAYSIVLCSKLNRITDGTKMAKLALEMLEQSKYKTIESRVRFMYYVFINHYSNHVMNSIEQVYENIKIGLNLGDYEYAGYSATQYLENSLICGESLTKVNEKYLETLSICQKLNHPKSLRLIHIYGQVIENLVQFIGEPHILKGTRLDESITIKDSLDNKDFNTCAAIYIWKIMLCVYFHKFEIGIVYSDQLKQILESIDSSVAKKNFYFYDSFLRLFLIHNNSSLRSSYLPIVKKNQKQLENWLKHSPMNTKNKWHCIEGLIYFINSNYNSARDHLDKAILFSKENRYVQEEALFYELSAIVQIKNHIPFLVEYYIQKSRDCYAIWGATTKIQQIEKLYSKYLKNYSSQTVLKSSHTVSKMVTTSSTIATTSIDIKSIIKIAQALSREIELKSLLEKIIGIIMENAGAERIVFLEKKYNNLVIMAEGIIGKSSKVLLNLPLEEVQNLPISLIHLVENSKQRFIYDNIFLEKGFDADSYIKTVQPKSVLCFPIQNKGVLTGIIYLENNAVTGAFTKDRIEILDILISQAMISLENARLFEASLKFIPSELMKNLNKTNIIDIRLGDQVQKLMTVLFCDIRSFTTLSEKMSPEDNFKFINSYLRIMGPIVRKNNGFIDKYIGDAIMALFEHSPIDALNTAIDMQREILSFNQSRMENGFEPIQIGVGIHIGNVMLGVVGESERLQGTVISDAVNLASRLEGLNKIYKTGILISESMYFQLKSIDSYQIRFIDRVRVKGKSKLVSIFEVYNLDTDEIIQKKNQNLELFESALIAFYYGKFKKSKNLFEKYLEYCPFDSVATIYLDRCIEILLSGMLNNDFQFLNQVNWQSTFNTNTEIIDEQHKELVNSINRLITGFAEGHGIEETEKTLLFLENYTLIHFGTEEELMIKFHYSHYDMHKKQHDEFIKEIKTLRRDIANRRSILPLILKIENYLLGWLVNHILKVDMKLGEFLQMNGHK